MFCEREYEGTPDYTTRIVSRPATSPYYTADLPYRKIDDVLGVSAVTEVYVRNNALEFALLDNTLVACY